MSETISNNYWSKQGEGVLSIFVNMFVVLVEHLYFFGIGCSYGKKIFA